MSLEQVQPGTSVPEEKDVEAGKWLKIRGWVGPEDAKNEIFTSVDRYQNAVTKPAF